MAGMVDGVAVGQGLVYAERSGPPGMMKLQFSKEEIWYEPTDV